jgi:type IV secretory pathway VirD2 relaxase
MTGDEVHPKLGHLRNAKQMNTPGFGTLVLSRRRNKGLTRLRKRKGLVWPRRQWRGTGTGARAAAGLISSDGRRALTLTRYSVMAGNLNAACKHMRYLLRDGVSRDGTPGRAYDAAGDNVDVDAFLKRSKRDPYQFRVLVSLEDGARLAELQPFIRDLMAQMRYDLNTNLDWIAVDHFNTGYPHTHIVIRGRAGDGKALVIDRNYIMYGMSARARALATLELGPVSELERLQKLSNEVSQERLTLLDRALLARSKDGVLTLAASPGPEPLQQTLQLGRLRTLQRLGLVQERQIGVWSLDAHLETRLRRLGQRADKFKMMQRALNEVGLDRGAAALALFERGPRKAPLVGRVLGTGQVDEMTERTWVVIDAADGRVHYAELGRLKFAEIPERGNLVVLAAAAPGGKPSSAPQLQLLSAIVIEQQTSYEGPTWIDRALLARWRPDPEAGGFGADLRRAFAARLDWLRERQLVRPKESTGELVPVPDMMRALRQLERQHLIATLSRDLGASYIASERGTPISGVYDRSIVTPTERLAVIRRQDTFTLMPWKPALEPLRGQLVRGVIGPHRVTWTRDRGRALPGPG